MLKKDRTSLRLLRRRLQFSVVIWFDLSLFSPRLFGTFWCFGNEQNDVCRLHSLFFLLCWEARVSFWAPWAEVPQDWEVNTQGHWFTWNLERLNWKFGWMRLKGSCLKLEHQSVFQWNYSNHLFGMVSSTLHVYTITSIVYLLGVKVTLVIDNPITLQHSVASYFCNMEALVSLSHSICITKTSWPAGRRSSDPFGVDAEDPEIEDSIGDMAQRYKDTVRSDVIQGPKIEGKVEKEAFIMIWIFDYILDILWKIWYQPKKLSQEMSPEVIGNDKSRWGETATLTIQEVRLTLNSWDPRSHGSDFFHIFHCMVCAIVFPIIFSNETCRRVT